MAIFTTKRKPTVSVAYAANHDDLLASSIYIEATVTALDGANWYYVELDDDINFGSPKAVRSSKNKIKFENLNTGTTYYARAAAFDYEGYISGFSSTANTTTGDENTNPSAPTSLVVNVIDLTNDGVVKAEGFSFSWSWARGSGPNIKAFEILVNDATTDTIFTIPATKVVDGTFTSTQLIPKAGKTYSAKVRAVSYGDRVSNWSTLVSSIATTSTTVSTDFSGNTKVTLNDTGLYAYNAGTQTFKLDATTGDFVFGDPAGDHKIIYDASEGTMSVPSVVVEDELAAKTILVSTTAGGGVKSGTSETFSSGSGFYIGKEGVRIGSTTGDYISYDISTGTLSLSGNATLDPSTELPWSQITSKPIANGAFTLPSQPSSEPSTYQNGLNLTSSYLGYYNGTAWKTYMDNTGKFYLGGTSGALQWDGSTLSITGNISISNPATVRTDLNVEDGAQVNTINDFEVGVWKDNMEYADATSFNAVWVNYSGSGEVSITTDSYSGGSSISIGNNSGNDQRWLIANKTFPYNPDKLYKITCTLKQTLGSGRAYIGVAGRNNTNTLWVNAAGDNLTTNQHYIAASNIDIPDAWTTYTGYFTGKAVSGTSGTNTTAETARVLQNGVYYFRPLILVNYNGQPGTTLIDSFYVEEMSKLDSLGYAGDLDATKGAPAGTYVGDTLAETVASGAIDGASAWSKFSGEGSTLPPGNVEFNFANSTSKGGNAINTDNVGSSTAETVSTATINFNADNDMDDTPVVNPTVPTDGTAIDHTINTDGSANISFEWNWAGNAGSIDGFIIFVRASTSDAAYTFGTTTSEEQVYYVTPEKRAHILPAVAANLYYTFGVQAYRIVNTSVDSDGVLRSDIVKSALTGENPYLPSSSVAFAGDITGTIDGMAASTVKTYAGYGNDAYTGTANIRSVNPPTNNGAFSSLTKVSTGDGNSVITVSYTYTQGTKKADSLLIYVKEGGGTVTTADPAYTTNPVTGSIKFTVKPSTTYTFGIQSIRMTDGGVQGTAITTSSSITTDAPNYTGNLNNQPIGDLATASTISLTSNVITDKSLANLDSNADGKLTKADANLGILPDDVIIGDLVGVETLFGRWSFDNHTDTNGRTFKELTGNVGYTTFDSGTSYAINNKGLTGNAVEIGSIGLAILKHADYYPSTYPNQTWMAVFKMPDVVGVDDRIISADVSDNFGISVNEVYSNGKAAAKTYNISGTTDPVLADALYQNEWHVAILSLDYVTAGNSFVAIFHPDGTYQKTTTTGTPSYLTNARHVVIGGNSETNWNSGSLTVNVLTGSYFSEVRYYRKTFTFSQAWNLAKAAFDMASPGTFSGLGDLDPTSNVKLAGIAEGATKNVIYRQTTAPTGGNYTEGDMWFDTDDGNHPYVWSGSAWSSVQDGDIAIAQGTADGKTISYYQATQPTGTLGDLWFDTDDGNKVYYYNGTSWVSAADSGIASAIEAASTAQSTADGKVTTYTSATAPTSVEGIGDLWYDTVNKLLKRTSTSPTPTWEVVSNAFDNTNELTDGAGLGTTAIWSSVTGTGKPVDNADVTRPTIGAKLNYSAFNTPNDGEAYIHGFNNSGVAADVNPSIMRNGALLTITKGMLNPNRVAKGYVIYRISSTIPGDSNKYAIAKPNGSNTLSWYVYSSTTPGNYTLSDTDYLVIGTAYTSAAELMDYVDIWQTSSAPSSMTDFDATKGAPSGTYVGGTLAETVEANAANGATAYGYFTDSVLDTASVPSAAAIQVTETGITNKWNSSAPDSSGLWLGNNKLGFYDGTTPYSASGWKTYMDNTGNFYLGGTAGALQWNGSNLKVGNSSDYIQWSSTDEQLSIQSKTVKPSKPNIIGYSGNRGGVYRWKTGSSTIPGGVNAALEGFYPRLTPYNSDGSPSYYVPSGQVAACIALNSNLSTYTQDLSVTLDGTSTSIPVSPSTKYEFSMYVVAHRCDVQLRIIELGASQGYLTETASFSYTSGEAVGNTDGTFENVGRLFLIKTTRSDTAYIRFSLRIRNYVDVPPNTACYAWAMMPKIAFADADQTQPSEWTEFILPTDLSDYSQVDVSNTFMTQTSNKIFIKSKGPSIEVGDLDLAHVGFRINGDWNNAWVMRTPLHESPTARGTVWFNVGDDSQYINFDSYAGGGLTLVTPELSIVDGSATFSGSLSGASAVFGVANQTRVDINNIATGEYRQYDYYNNLIVSIGLATTELNTPLDTTILFVDATDNTYYERHGVVAKSAGKPAIWGTSTSNHGVHGEGTVGVWGKGSTHGGWFTSDTGYGLVARSNYNNAAGWAVHAEGAYNGIYGRSSHGSGYAILGRNTESGGVAVKGDATQTFGTGIAVEANCASPLGWDFYASGTGANYGPFTGAHECLVSEDEYNSLEVGDIVVDGVCYKAVGTISQTICYAIQSSEPNQKGVVGVYVSEGTPLSTDENKIPVGLSGVSPDTLDEMITQNVRKSSINSLGEGQVNVCGMNGNIAAGDLIVSSSIPGKGMKQDDDIIHSYTVAKARESVTFDYPEQVKMIACIYLCG